MMDQKTRRTAPSRPRCTPRARVRPLEALEARLVMSTTPTTVTLLSATDLAFVGNPLPLTALVRTDGPTPADAGGGTVTFRDGTTVLGTAPVTAGRANLVVPGLAPGTHRFSASYGGTDQLGASGTAVDGIGVISIYAGNRTSLDAPDGSPAGVMRLANPQGMAFDAAGNLYIADGLGNKVRKVTPAGIMTTFAGGGTSLGDGGPATSAALDDAAAVAADAAGNVYIADAGNRRVRKVAPDGTITTFAGGGSAIGDGGQAAATFLVTPRGLAVDGAGNVYIADADDNRIRRVATDGTITTVAGTGARGYDGDGGQATAATLNQPNGVAVDAAGSVYIADTNNGSVRRVTPDGVITRVAGVGAPGVSPFDPTGDGGLALGATLQTPVSLAFDAAGNLFIGDRDGRRVRRVTPGGVISTVAGTGVFDSTGNGTPSQFAAVFSPGGVAFDAAGNLYVSEILGVVVRKVSATRDVNVVPLAATSVTLAASTDAARVGDKIRLTAIVVSPAGVVSAGTATFLDGSTVLGTAPVFDGVASLDVQVFPAGTRRYSARYERGGGFLSSQAAVSPASVVFRAAGTVSGSPAGDGGPALSAVLTTPTDLAFDAAGNLYIADTGSSTIRRVATDGTITTVAGGGTSLDNGVPASSARLARPSAVLVDLVGNIYIADSGNHVVRRVAPDGTITTVAGTGVEGSGGDGGPATSAQLRSPADLAFDPSGNLIIADSDDRRVRRVTPDGIITTIAGGGTAAGANAEGISALSAALVSPQGIAFDGAGNLLIADYGNYLADPASGRIYRVTPVGIITTAAGGGTSSAEGVPATSALVVQPRRVAVDSAGNIYIPGLNFIQRVSTSGIITKLAGDGGFGAPRSDGLPAGSTTLGSVDGLTFDPAGNLFYSDSVLGTVRRIEVTRDVDAKPLPARFNVAVAGTVVAGVATDVTITAVDADGNVLRDYTGPVRLVVSDFQGLFPPIPVSLDSQDGVRDGQQVDLVDGVATVPLTFYTPGARLLQVTSLGTIAATGLTTFNVVAGPLAYLNVTVERGPGELFSQIQGSRPLFVRFTTTDALGNLVTGQAATATVTTSDPLMQTLGFPSDTDLSDGAGFVYLRFGTPGFYPINFNLVVDGRTISTSVVFASIQAITPGRIVRSNNGATATDPSQTTGLAGRTVYIDSNNNGRLDDGEVSAVSDANGNYSLEGIARADAPVRDAGDRSSVFRNNVTTYADVGDGSALVALIPTSAVAPPPGYPSDLFDATSRDEATNYVRTLYRAVLGRDGSAFEVDTWVAGLNAGQTREGVSAQFLNSPEHRRQQVDAYYRTFFKRDADVFSQVWVDQLRSGVSEAEVVTAILASPEYQALHRDDASFVAALYQDGLGRDVDSVGRVDGAAALAGGLDRAALVRRVLGSEEAIDQVLDGFYNGYLARRRDATSSDWAALLRSRRGSASTVAAGILASGEFYRQSQSIRAVD